MKNKFVYTILSVFILLTMNSASAWSGGPGGNASIDPNDPNIGTHDLILNNAINMLPNNFSDQINMTVADYASEMPDFNSTECNCTDGIGDMGKHHIYYRADGTVQEADAADRAKSEYNLAMSNLTVGDKYNFSKHLGIMSHYIADSSVYAHTMGNHTDWGNENLSNHGHFEYYVNTREDEFFVSKYIKFDGNFSNVSAYDAALMLGNDTTFDNKFGDGTYTNVWMEEMMNNSEKVPPYAFGNAAFKARTRQSINYSVNLLADVIHTMISLNNTANSTQNPITTPVPTSPPSSGSSGSSGSSSGGGGGGGLSSAEPYENIYKYEVQEMEVLTTPVSFKYKNPELAIYEVSVTSTQSDIASLRIEVLRNTSKLVGMPAFDAVYKNLNAWIDYKRIKNATIRFKVANSWISENGLSSESIKMSKWDKNNKVWTELSTVVISKDDTYTYFESQIVDMSGSFAIGGTKDEVPAQVESSVNLETDDSKAVEQTEIKPVSTENPKAPGFGTVLSIISIVSMVYLVRRLRK